VNQPVHAGAPTVEKLPPPDARVLMLDLPHIPVSSSEIRRRLRAGRSVLYMVPMEVAKILREKRYYL
jgi:nicotinic acid mononucleotide adenylyltransferase